MSVVALAFMALGCENCQPRCVLLYSHNSYINHLCYGYKNIKQSSFISKSYWNKRIFFLWNVHFGEENCDNKVSIQQFFFCIRI